MAKKAGPKLVLRGTAKPSKRPAANQVRFSADIADDICQRLAEGESLLQICRLPGYPRRATVMRWLLNDDPAYDAFRDSYARAREMQAEVLADETIDIADGTKRVRKSHVAIESARLRIDARKWLAAKLRPKKYGDKITHDGTLEVRRDAKELTDDELAALVAGASSSGTTDKA